MDRNWKDQQILNVQDEHMLYCACLTYSWYAEDIDDKYSLFSVNQEFQENMEDYVDYETYYHYDYAGK